MIHLEVPLRYVEDDYWGHVISDYESRYNHEPFWTGAISADFATLAAEAGFEDAVAGYHDATVDAKRGETGHFGTENKGVYKSWYLVSARKPTNGA